LAKVFLKRNPKGFFITGDKGFFKLEKELYYRVIGTRELLEKL